MVADGVNGTAGTSADHAANTTPQHPAHGMAARPQHGLDDGHVGAPGMDALELGVDHLRARAGAGSATPGACEHGVHAHGDYTHSTRHVHATTTSAATEHTDTTPTTA